MKKIEKTNKISILRRIALYAEFLEKKQKQTMISKRNSWEKKISKLKTANNKSRNDKNNFERKINSSIFENKFRERNESNLAKVKDEKSTQSEKNNFFEISNIRHYYRVRRHFFKTFRCFNHFLW